MLGPWLELKTDNTCDGYCLGGMNHATVPDRRCPMEYKATDLAEAVCEEDKLQIAAESAEAWRRATFKLVSGTGASASLIVSCRPSCIGCGSLD